MKKKTILALTAAAIMTTYATPAFAGPEMFAAVPAKHWSYDAVAQLAKAGIIDGYEDGYNGRSKITRYEMAIMVANAMTNSQKATAQQKESLDKLMKEFSSELTSLGATVSKETKQTSVPAPAASPFSKVKISFEDRVSYNYTSLGSTDGGGLVNPANPNGYVADKNQFSHRLRVMIDTPFGENDQWMFKSRLFTQKMNLSNGETTAFRFDRYYVTNNDILGGKLEIGKNFVHPGKAGFFNLAGDTDSVIYTWTDPGKKFSTRIGVGRATPLMNQSNETTGVFLGELKFKPTAKSDIELYNIKQDNLNSVKDFNLWGLAGAMEVDKKSGLTLSFEVAQNKPSDSQYEKTGWWVALNSNYKATIYNPGMFVTLVNPNKKGDHGWALSYRHMPTGVAGKNNRAALIPWLPLSADTFNASQNAFNDINAWRFDYMYIPTKNVQLQFAFDHIKPINGNWTNNSIQTAVVFMF